jgi:hypothetical protein
MVEELRPPQTHNDKGDTISMSTIHAPARLQDTPAEVVALVDGPAWAAVRRIRM